MAYCSANVRLWPKADIGQTVLRTNLRVHAL